ncbi:MAG: hypothetical protein DRP87_09165 [Spirochaetes bacterium]|nr:MAG: hypothetical protein DRP87_09165 [Spirochaetota bacterium]
MNVRRLAELSDVSVATISRVLNGDPAVEHVTRERVISVLAQHPFYPDLKQKKKRNRNIFLFLSPIQISERLYPHRLNFFSRTLAGVKYQLDLGLTTGGKDYYLMLSSYRNGRIEEKLKSLEEVSFFEAIAGVFIIHSNLRDNEALTSYRGRLKLYLLNRNREDVDNPFVDCIYFDESMVSSIAFDHLTTRGHRKILVFSGPEEYSFFLHRESAFRENADSDEFEIYLRRAEQNTPSAAQRLIETVFEKEHLPITAVYVTSEILLEGVLPFLDQRGISIPDEISILSTNDYLIGYQHIPPISVIRTPSFEIGKLAALIAIENTNFDFGTSVDYCLKVILNDRGSVKINERSA